MRRVTGLLCLMALTWLPTSGVAGASALQWKTDAVLSDYIKEHYPWAEVEIKNLVFHGKVPEDAPIRIMVDKGPPGKTVFSLEFENGQKITATAEVRALDWIVMSARPFRKGYRFQEGDVYMKLTDAARIPGGAVRNAGLVIDKILTRSVLVNTPILSGMVTDAPPVKRGQKVTLVIDAANFRMTASGETREGSYVGSYVKAVNSASRKTVVGQLLDANTVKVEF